jgi:RNA polymerase sigma factor (sigma-70 family)
MAHTKPATFTGKLSREIDAAYDAYKAGEPLASDRLHKALSEQARNIVWYAFELQDEHLPLDIATRAMMRLHTFQGRSKASTWFYRIAQNEAKRALRERVTDKKRHISITPPDEDDGPGVEIEAKPQGEDDKLHIAELRQGVPEEQDRVIEFLMEGHSLEEIAENTGTPKGTIRSRYRLAKKKMRKRGRVFE